MASELCGQVLNRLHEPCHLPLLHDGFHEGLATVAADGTPVFVQWWTPGAPAGERRYFRAERSEASTAADG